MKPGAVLCNAGQFDYEIDLAGLRAMQEGDSRQARPRPREPRAVVGLRKWQGRRATRDPSHRTTRGVLILAEKAKIPGPIYPPPNRTGWWTDRGARLHSLY